MYIERKEKGRYRMEFRDLKRQYEALKLMIDAAIKNAVEETRFISGPQVVTLERELADYVGVRHCITCANGTDALTLALMAWGIGSGDAVFVPDFTFFSSGESPAYLGATPIYVDVDRDTYNIDPSKLEAAILKIKAEGRYIPKAVIAVDLFGQPADYPSIKPTCEKYGLYLLEDGAQGFGGSIKGKMACSFGDISTTSFFPAKPLGCYGDGGAVFTDDDGWAALLRSLSVHGKNGKDRYDNARIGMNSRLDTIQAAILLVKLAAFRKHELDDIKSLADQYTEKLTDYGVMCPVVKSGFKSSWAQYTIQLPREIDRSALQNKMQKEDIPTMVYYKKPMHLQAAFGDTYSATADCPVTKQLCDTVLSLPIGPYMTDAEVEYVSGFLKKFLDIC